MTFEAMRLRNMHSLVEMLDPRDETFEQWQDRLAREAFEDLKAARVVIEAKAKLRQRPWNPERDDAYMLARLMDQPICEECGKPCPVGCHAGCPRPIQRPFRNDRPRMGAEIGDVVIMDRGRHVRTERRPSMRVGFQEDHFVDGGGHTNGIGFTIAWQNGPLGRGAERKQPNGAFVEDVIDACVGRLQFYQRQNDGKFSCRENREAIEALRHALKVLDDRTQRREAAGIEGTHAGEDTPSEPRPAAHGGVAQSVDAALHVLRNQDGDVIDGKTEVPTMSRPQNAATPEPYDTGNDELNRCLDKLATSCTTPDMSDLIEAAGDVLEAAGRPVVADATDTPRVGEPGDVEVSDATPDKDDIA